MRDINSLASSKIKKAWTVNNIMANEPVSIIKQQNRLYKSWMLDMKSPTTNQWFSTLDLTWIVTKRTSYSKLLTEFEELFDGTLCDWKNRACFL
jgi:hypothetical protein